MISQFMTPLKISFLHVHGQPHCKTAGKEKATNEESGFITPQAELNTDIFGAQCHTHKYKTPSW